MTFALKNILFFPSIFLKAPLFLSKLLFLLPNLGEH